jgi:endonuclease III
VIGCAKQLMKEFGSKVPRTVEEMERLPGSSDPETVERELMAQLPRAKWTVFSNAMILHVYDECEWPEKLRRS